MSNVAINRETGEILVLSPEGQWQPAQRARNPQTGAEVYSDGRQWLPVPQAPQPAPTTGESLARGAGLATRALGPMAAGAATGAGIGALAGGVGAIPGAIAGATAAGLAQPIADLAVSAWNAATGGRQALPSQATEQLMTAAGLPVPQPGAERVASTALRAGAEAMTGVGAARQIAGVPIAAVSPTLPSQSALLAARPPASPVTRGVAETLASAPGLQTAAATTGATATQGLLDAGAPAEVAIPGGVAASMLPALRPQNLFPRMGGPVREENVTRLREAGVPLTPAQDLGNPSASVFESVMRYLPTSAPRVARAEDEQARAWTRAVNRQFGLDSDIATPEVLTAYQRQWGARADALEAATLLRPDETFARQVGDMRSQYRRGLDDGMYRSFSDSLRRVEEFVAARAQGAQMPGTNFRQIDSELGFAVDTAKNSADPTIRAYGQAMERLRDSFHGLLQRSAQATPAPSGAPSGAPQLSGPGGQALLAGPGGGANVPALTGAAGQPAQSGQDLAQAWRDLNREYALFSRVREAMGSATGRDKLNTGFIPPAALAQTERASIGPESFATSRDPFTSLVRAGAAVLPNPTPNSGTAQRTFAQDLLTGARRGAPVAAAGGAAEAAGLSLLDPVLALGLPYGVSRLWYGRPLDLQTQGLLGMQSLYGATQAQD